MSSTILGLFVAWYLMVVFYGFGMGIVEGYHGLVADVVISIF